MNALRDQFRGRARIWVAAFLVSSVLSIMVYLLGSPWYVMFTPMETVRNFALFWLILFFLFGLTKKGKGHLLLLVVGTSLLGWGLLTFGRRSLTERLIAIGSKLCEDEVKVPKFEVGLDLSQKAEAQFRSNKKPIFVSASFYAFIPSGSPTLPPRRVQLATEDEIARVDVATFS